MANNLRHATSAMDHKDDDELRSEYTAANREAFLEQHKGDRVVINDKRKAMPGICDSWGSPKSLSEDTQYKLRYQLFEAEQAIKTASSAIQKIKRLIRSL